MRLQLTHTILLLCAGWVLLLPSRVSAQAYLQTLQLTDGTVFSHVQVIHSDTTHVTFQGTFGRVRIPRDVLPTPQIKFDLSHLLSGPIHWDFTKAKDLSNWYRSAKTQYPHFAELITHLHAFFLAAHLGGTELQALPQTSQISQRVEFLQDWDTLWHTTVTTEAVNSPTNQTTYPVPPHLISAIQKALEKTQQTQGWSKSELHTALKQTPFWGLLCVALNQTPPQNTPLYRQSARKSDLQGIHLRRTRFQILQSSLHYLQQQFYADPWSYLSTYTPPPEAPILDIHLVTDGRDGKIHGKLHISPPHTIIQVVLTGLCISQGESSLLLNLGAGGRNQQEQKHHFLGHTHWLYVQTNESYFPYVP